MVLFLRAKLVVLRDGVASEMHTRPTLILRAAQDGWKIGVYQVTRIMDGPRRRPRRLRLRRKGRQRKG